MKFQGKLLSELISENIFYSDARTITRSDAQSIEKDEELSELLCSDARDEASVNTFRPSILDQAFSAAKAQGFSPDKVVVLSIGPPSGLKFQDFFLVNRRCCRTIIITISRKYFPHPYYHTPQDIRTKIMGACGHPSTGPCSSLRDPFSDKEMILFLTHVNFVTFNPQ